MSKARNGAPIILHAIARAKERYGLDMTVDDLGRICRMIQRNEGKLDKQNADGKTQWFLTYRDTYMRVVISQDFYKVCTFLPLSDAGKHDRDGRKSRRFYRGGRTIYLGDKI